METRGSAQAFALRSMQTHATNILASGFYILNRNIYISYIILLWGIFYFSFFYFWTRRLHFLWHNGNNEVRKRRHFFSLECFRFSFFGVCLWQPNFFGSIPPSVSRPGARLTKQWYLNLQATVTFAYISFGCNHGLMQRKLVVLFVQ